MKTDRRDPAPVIKSSQSLGHKGADRGPDAIG